MIQFTSIVYLWIYGKRIHSRNPAREVVCTDGPVSQKAAKGEQDEVEKWYSVMTDYKSIMGGVHIRQVMRQGSIHGRVLMSRMMREGRTEPGGVRIRGDMREGGALEGVRIGQDMREVREPEGVHIRQDMRAVREPEGVHIGRDM